PVPTPTPTPTPTATPTPGPTVPSYLSASITRQWTTGLAILFNKKAHAEVQAINDSWFYSAKGVLSVSFTKDGKIVETQAVTINLAPAEIRTYTFDAKETSDAATLALLPAN
ncbi:MAG: hypothetical protein FJZ01_27290, partial [Candidatus Sericytochromatia bacterium]|nr:hypothetical protein [Candidatus Tanganyikabacteria bacterium]